MEMLAGKVASMTGQRIDATAFQHKPVQELERMLLKSGFSKTGREVLYHPYTGLPLEGTVYMGPIYYQRLKHMVGDKMHARSKGKLVGLTRQPNDGRARGGGLRWGEMERDCGLASGASGVLHERMCTSSDAYNAPVCKDCGYIGTIVKGADGVKECKTCKKRDVKSVQMPYAGKLLVQELMSMGISTKLILDT